MKVTLPLPPTTNHSYRSGKSGWYKVREAREWEDEAIGTIRRAWKRKTLECPVYVSIVQFIKFRRDIDGGVKIVNDVLQKAGVIENDTQVVHMNLQKYEDKKNPRCEVEVEECYV